MKDKITALAFGALIVATSAVVRAQPQGKVHRLGYLSGVSRSAEGMRRDAFTQGLRDLGYIDGRNTVIEYRYSDGKNERLPALAAELVRLKPEIIVTGGSPSTRAAKEATSTIPHILYISLFPHTPVSENSAGIVNVTHDCTIATFPTYADTSFLLVLST